MTDVEKKTLLTDECMKRVIGLRFNEFSAWLNSPGAMSFAESDIKLLINKYLNSLSPQIRKKVKTIEDIKKIVQSIVLRPEVWGESFFTGSIYFSTSKSSKEYMMLENFYKDDINDEKKLTSAKMRTFSTALTFLKEGKAFVVNLIVPAGFDFFPITYALTKHGKTLQIDKITDLDEYIFYVIGDFDKILDDLIVWSSH